MFVSFLSGILSKMESQCILKFCICFIKPPRKSKWLELGSSCHNPKSSGQSSYCFPVGWPNTLAFYSHPCDLTAPQPCSCWMVRPPNPRLTYSISSLHHPSCAQTMPHPSPQAAKIKTEILAPMTIFFPINSNKTTFTKRCFLEMDFSSRGWVLPPLKNQKNPKSEWLTVDICPLWILGWGKKRVLK